MAESVRELAIQAVIAKILSLTGTRPWGGAYPNNPVAERLYKDPKQVNQFPHFMVLEADGSGAELATVQGAGGDYEHALELEVGCYVLGDDLITPSTWKQRAWDDVFKAMNKLTVGGHRVPIALTGYRTDDGDWFPFGIWWQGYRLVLDESVEVT